MDINSHKKDTLFQKRKKITPFKFNDEVANVFDDMAMRSIPFYANLLELIASSISFLCSEQSLGVCTDKNKKNIHIVDLGCSTGNLVFYLKSILKETKFSYLGIDNSNAMLKIASSKYSEDHIKFRNEDISHLKKITSNVICSNFCLQFIPPAKRKNILKNIYTYLEPNGLLFLSEKNKIETKKIESSFTKSYTAYKEQQGYSHLEISQKRDALENILIPWTKKEYILALKESGFKKIEPIFQWGLFSSLLAIK